jgi:hypothetical protein
MAKEYPTVDSQVEIELVDGQVRTFVVSASMHIVHHLMREAAQTGVLVMRDDVAQVAHCIPLKQIMLLNVRQLSIEATTERRQ